MKKLLSLLLAILLLTGCAETYDGPTEPSSVCIGMEVESYNPDGSISGTYREEYAYDLYGNRSRVQSWYDDIPGEKSILRYDEAGRMTWAATFHSGFLLPIPAWSYRYTYDDQGRMTSTVNRYRWEKTTTTVTYDDEARTRTTVSEGSTIVEYLDENGWVTRSESFFPDRGSISEEFDRNADGTRRSSRSYEDGVLISEEICTYDDRGRLLTQTEIADGICTLLFSFEYGEGCEKRTDADGSVTVTEYNPDGTMDCQVHYDEAGRLTAMSRYRYTEIQIPAEEVSP